MHGGTYVPIGSLAVSVTWQATAGVTLRLDVNLKAEEQHGFAPVDGSRHLAGGLLGERVVAIAGSQWSAAACSVSVAAS